VTDVLHTLSREAIAARTLLDNVRDILAGDDDAIEDAIEGETNLKEACVAALKRLSDIDAMLAALKTQADNLKARASRLDSQAETIRGALSAALAAGELRKLELPAATVSLRPTPPKVIVTDEAEIPGRFFVRADPRLDRKALLDALKAQETVPGAALGNGGETVSIRWR